MSPGLVSAMARSLAAEYYMRLRAFSRAKHLVAVQAAWPYIIVAVIVALGEAYGDLEVYARNVGVDNPMLFLFTASAVALSSLSAVTYTASSIIWARWLGTLEYVALSSPSIAVYVAASGFAGASLTTLTVYLSVAPAVAYFGGLEDLKVALALAGLTLLGLASLLAVGVLAGLASVALRLESNVLEFIPPLLVLLSGVFYPVWILPPLLEAASKLVPLYYVVEAAKLYTSVAGASLEAAAPVYLAALLGLAYAALLAPAAAYLEKLMSRRGF